MRERKRGDREEEIAMRFTNVCKTFVYPLYSPNTYQQDT